MGGNGMFNLGSAFNQDDAFSLGDEIAEWRRALLSRDAIGRAEAEELEDHLRQEIERLSGQGLSAREAFAAATERVGSVESLGGEYAKVNRYPWWNKRLQPVLVGYLAMTGSQPIRLTQPMGLFGTLAVFCLLFYVANPKIPGATVESWLYDVMENPETIWLRRCVFFMGMEAANQIMAAFLWRKLPERKKERFTAASVLYYLLCFLLPPVGIVTWLLLDDKTTARAAHRRRAGRSAVRGVFMLLIAFWLGTMAVAMNSALVAIGYARIMPLDPVKAERVYQEKKRLKAQRSILRIDTSSPAKR
jgi:hypothetical protein